MFFHFFVRLDRLPLFNFFFFKFYDRFKRAFTRYTNNIIRFTNNNIERKCLLFSQITTNFSTNSIITTTIRLVKNNYKIIIFYFSFI